MEMVMCAEQFAAYSTGAITRMQVGVFRCAHADPNVVDVDTACDYVGLWEAPLYAEPECPECHRPAALIEVG